MMHAVSESSHDLILPPDEAWKFELVRDNLGMQFQTGSWRDGDIRLSNTAHFSHEVPSSRIGRLSRTLIFPHSIATSCRSMWQPKRQHKFGFTGLITEQRKEVLSEWLKHFRKFGALSSILLWTWLGISRKLTRISVDGHSHLALDASRRGREFPTKCWDVEYYQLMGNCEFILCPNGDFVWTYRFFEAILCGAIPVVQESCPAYHGFKFLVMSPDNISAEWSKDVAQHNYELCIDRVTLPLDQLSEELELSLQS
jgi:hypothetical protein